MDTALECLPNCFVPIARPASLDRALATTELRGCGTSSFTETRNSLVLVAPACWMITVGHLGAGVGLRHSPKNSQDANCKTYEK